MREPATRDDLTADEQRTLVERIVDYERAYLETMRADVARYQSIASEWPLYLTNHRRSEIFVAPDGVVAARYLASDDSLAVHVDDRRSIQNIAAACTPDWSAMKANFQKGGFSIDRPPKKYYGIQVRTTGVIGSHLAANGFLGLTISNAFDPSAWGGALGHAEAANDVSTFVAGHLMGLSPGTKSLDQFEAETSAKLAEAIESFRQLLDRQPLEFELQRFLERHPILLAAGHVAVMPQFRLGSEYIVDFVVEFPERRYVLVEIEAAHHKLYTKGGDETKAFKHAEKQVLDWKMWIDDGGDYARTLLPGVIDPECWVVMGRRPTERKERRFLERKQRSFHRISHLTYDDLLDRASQLLANLLAHVRLNVPSDR